MCFLTELFLGSNCHIAREKILPGAGTPGQIKNENRKASFWEELGLGSPYLLLSLLRNTEG